MRSGLEGQERQREKVTMTARARKGVGLKLALACGAIAVSGYFIIRSLGIGGAGGPTRAEMREVEAEQAELRRLAPPEAAPTEVKLKSGRGPG